MNSITSTSTVERVVRAVQQVAGGQSGIAADTELLESGVLDSLGVMRVIAQVETDFDLKLPLMDLSIENLSTPEALASLVDAKLTV